MTSLETGIAERAPTLTLPRKREREFDLSCGWSDRIFVVMKPSSLKRSLFPLPLAGEG